MWSLFKTFEYKNSPRSSWGILATLIVADTLKMSSKNLPYEDSFLKRSSFTINNHKYSPNGLKWSVGCHINQEDFEMRFVSSKYFQSAIKVKNKK